MIASLLPFAVIVSAYNLHPRDQIQESSTSCNVTTSMPQAGRWVEVTIKHDMALGPFVPQVVMAMGSPPQEILATLDTGSGDLLIGKSNSSFCETAITANCSAPSAGGRGSFDPSKSDDVETVSSQHAIFFNGEVDDGEYKKAAASIGGATLPKFQFGLVDRSTTREGTEKRRTLLPLLGVSPILGEQVLPLYSNLPAHMVDLGVIKSNVFGLYMNDFRAPEGFVVFGGVDAAKFTGDLKEAPLVPDNGTLNRFLVEFSSFQLVDTTNMASQNMSEPCKETTAETNSKPAATANSTGINLSPQAALPPAFIDTGNTQVLVPPESIDIIAKAIGAKVVNGFVGPVPCEALLGRALRFGFNKDNAILDVPLELMKVPDGVEPDLDPGMCDTVIGSATDLPAGEKLVSLGAPMMQAMYIVFDAQRSRILFAPAVLNSTKSDPRELGADWTGTVTGTGNN
ncbi:hypothetical protein NLG97_g1031 [Lecanicillium saksenae]|uniref:Uncharacterized protein n=1 Tax=Lecanicillium saksenae TaxID=468837 RepID=A0ACC1R676_9HYPO|nr:hypothetical protein NLG97_g1031 [Lecanicillium saksenae]